MSCGASRHHSLVKLAMHVFVLEVRSGNIEASRVAGAQALGAAERRRSRSYSLWNSDQCLAGHCAAPGRACRALHAVHNVQGLSVLLPLKFWYTSQTRILHCLVMDNNDNKILSWLT